MFVFLLLIYIVMAYSYEQYGFYSHYKFEVAPRNPFGAKSTQSDNTVRSNLDSAGNRRPPKAQVARKCASPMVSEEIEQIRNIMKDACEQFIDPNTTQLYKPTTVIQELKFYVTKLIGRLRSNGASRKPDGEILKITKQIKKLFRNISDGTTNEEENEPDSAEDMLKCIEKSFCQCQQQIEWYKQEKEKVEAEIEKLANDVIDADGGIEKGIHEQINYVRLQMEQQKRKYLESVSMYKQEKSCVETELNTLANAVKCLNEVENVNKQCKLETKEDSEFRVVKVIRQIRRSLEFQNCQTQERLKELESQYNKQVFGELCTLLNMDIELRQKGGSNDNWKLIVKNMKRLVKDKDQFVDHAGKLLNDLSTLINREPFSLTLSGHSDTKRVQVQEPDFQHLLSGLHNVKLCLEEYRESHKEKFVKVEDLNELRECRKRLQKEIAELKEEKDLLLNRLVKDRGQFVDHARTLLKDISTLITREPFSLTMSEHSDTKRVQVLTPDFQQLVYDMNNVKLCLEEYRKSHKEKFLKIEAWNELKECEKTLQKEIEELKEEKDVLLNRLSKMAGANLTDNNPAIADLSDPNRATKLAEQFSELYDNSWTDAYEVLEISDENECIQYLLNIIVESYNMCSDISKMQQRALARALHNPTEGLSIKTIANEKVNHDSDVNLSKLQSRTLSDLRKTSVDLSIVDVKSYITAKNENWVRKGELKQFTMSCIELCWFMHLQSPPVYLDATLVSGSTLDTNTYKPYTKSGKKIDFIVWPSLYLHKDGPILCKGVAQGK